MSQPPKTVVIGAGPVGALAALYAAQRGHTVEVYELRSDLRDPSTTPLNFTRSINLALSQRGISALRDADPDGALMKSVMTSTIPMYGRMIHGKGKAGFFEDSQNYDVHGRAIYAADRGDLNKKLLDYLETMPNVKILFDHKLTGADFKRNKAWLELRKTFADTGKISTRRAHEIEIDFDFMIGADGAHSAARFHVMKYARMSYMQEYVDTVWCEFHAEAGESDLWKSGKDGYQISPNHLHIWPAGNMMFIAIPSSDQTFTCTLFMPASEFERIDAQPAQILPFFESKFPGVVDGLIPATKIQEQYLNNQHLPLISIKCSPYHFGSSAVVIGDAAHAMVPFYGQGMNAGLEDVRVLFNILDEFETSDPKDLSKTRAAALAEYTKRRAPDAHAINDLAMGNYQEMSSDVKSPLYLLRKAVEEKLDSYLPSLGFATQYSRVSFGDEPYAEVVKAVEYQGKVLRTSASILAALSLIGVAAWRFQKA